MGLFDSINGFLGLNNEFHADGYKVDPNAITSPYQSQYAAQLSAAQAQAPGQAMQVQAQGYDTPMLGQAGLAQAYGGPAGLNLAASNQIRDGELGLIGLQQNVAQGGTSVAQAQLLAERDANMRSLQAAAASQRGDVNPALTQRTLLNAYADQGQQTGQNFAALRAQEMQAAQQNLGNTFNNVRGADVNIAGQNANIGLQNANMFNNTAQFNAGQQNQFALSQSQLAQAAGQFNAGARQNAMLSNQSAGLTQQTINNAHNEALLQQYGGLAQNAIQNQMNAQQIQAGSYDNAQQINSGVAAGNAGAARSLAGGLFDAAAGTTAGKALMGGGGGAGAAQSLATAAAL